MESRSPRRSRSRGDGEPRGAVQRQHVRDRALRHAHVPTTVLPSLATGAIVVGVVSVASAPTLLPAILSLLGDRINALRVPYLGRNVGRSDAAEGRFWQAIVRRVMHRPAVSLGLGLAAEVERPAQLRLTSPR